MAKMQAEEAEKKSRKTIKKDPRAIKGDDSETESCNVSKTDVNYDTDTDSKAAYDTSLA